MTSTEADVPITHTRKQDVVWFYSTIFLAPALVIGAGVRSPGSRAASSASRARRAAPTPPATAAAQGVRHDRPRAAVQGGLAALGLLAALRHLAARAGAGARRGDVIDASKTDVSLIHYEDDTTAVEFDARARRRRGRRSGCTS